MPHYSLVCLFTCLHCYQNNTFYPQQQSKSIFFNRKMWVQHGIGNLWAGMHFAPHHSKPQRVDKRAPSCQWARLLIAQKQLFVKCKRCCILHLTPQWALGEKYKPRRLAHNHGSSCFHVGDNAELNSACRHEDQESFLNKGYNHTIQYNKWIIKLIIRSYLQKLQ